jgi:hypothetical protein
MPFLFSKNTAGNLRVFFNLEREKFVASLTNKKIGREKT